MEDFSVVKLNSQLRFHKYIFLKIHILELAHYIYVMQVLIVADSFKESLDAGQVAGAIAAGLNKIQPQLTPHCIPFSDGGEGALSVLEKHAKGALVACETVDALGRPISANYFVFEEGKKAWIELSQASGLALIDAKDRNPLVSSTYGTGLLIKDALEKGCTEIVLGIGGSATNDAAAGIFQALDGQLFDKNKAALAKGGAALQQLETIVFPTHLDHIKWEIACDVDNPLLGPNGASAVYGPQKGATQGDVEHLEAALTQLATTLEKKYQRKVDQLKGGGAAGGTAAGMAGFFGATLVPGFQLLSEMIQLEKAIEKADIVFTAEGKIDQQSLHGKVPVEVARLAKKHHKTCIGLAGAIEGPLPPLYEAGFSGLFSIQQSPMSLEASKEQAAALLTETAANIFHFYQQTTLK